MLVASFVFVLCWGGLAFPSRANPPCPQSALSLAAFASCMVPLANGTGTTLRRTAYADVPMGWNPTVAPQPLAISWAGVVSNMMTTGVYVYAGFFPDPLYRWALSY